MLLYNNITRNIMMVTSFSIVFLMSKIVSQIHVSLFIDKINIFFVKIHPCYGAEETAEWNKILVRKLLISPPFYGLYTHFCIVIKPFKPDKSKFMDL